MSVRWRRGAWLGAALGGVVLAVLPSIGNSTNRNNATERQLSRLSQSVGLRYWTAHPDEAPAALRAGFSALTASTSALATSDHSHSEQAFPGRFNHDSTGLPQNEESISACKTNLDTVLGGTNDFRGRLDPQGNFTGWHFSNNGGESLTKEGLLPAIEGIPSGGDPVDVVGAQCALYAADLNFDPADPLNKPNGIGVYASTPETVQSCPGGADPSCWPVRRLVAHSAPGHFLDKVWMDVGDTGDGEHVWATYSDFVNDASATFGYSSNSIMAVRCTPDLVTCSPPILISGAQNSIQFSDVTVGPDGRTYITWEQDNDLDNPAPPPEAMRFWMRVAEPGSTTFGPPRLVADEPLNLGIAHLHANDFRAATYPKNTVTMVDGRPRAFVVWEGCTARPTDLVCEEPQIKLVYSDDYGATWSSPQVLSVGGDNYFATIDEDGAGHLAVAWYTNRRDPTFHSRQQVELVTLNAATLAINSRRLVNRTPNDTQADPTLGGAFIGDYIEVSAQDGHILLHYNANYRKEPLLGEGVPVPQQDNYLWRTTVR
jgi:hypothetical protein